MSEYDPSGLKDAEALRKGYTSVQSDIPQITPGPAERELTSRATTFGVAEKPEVPATAGGRRATWAVIVTHGMGQQVHFDTLEQVVLALLNAQLRAKPKKAAVVNSRIVKLPYSSDKDIELLRAEMEVTSPTGDTTSVDIYESYWAPLTEGKVSLWDCIKFLGEGAWGGFQYLVRTRGFVRWVFGDMRQFRIHYGVTAIKLVTALFILFGPVLLASLVTFTQIGGALPAMLGINSGVSRGNAGIMMRAFAPDMLWFEILLLLYVFAVWLLPKLYNSRGIAKEIHGGLQAMALVISLVSIASLFFVELRFLHRACIVYLPNCPGWLATLWRYPAAAFMPFLSAISHYIFRPFAIERERLAVIWVVALLAALVSRWFLIEFMGDVAVYVSAHKLSKFNELRDAIQTCVGRVISGVYWAQVNNTPLPQMSPQSQLNFLYDNIIIVGHSLGSVISYDVLNHLLVSDEIERTSGHPGLILRVEERTKLLLTFGSPLDKTAFLFRIKGGTDELREAAAANWQPLIRDYGFRPEKWINLYSWMDIISGRLMFYDHPDEDQGGEKRVDNVFDPDALLPLVAHNEYWQGKLLGDILYQRLCGQTTLTKLTAPRSKRLWELWR